MRNLLLATAAIPFAALTTSVLPASADTVVRRETIVTREAPARFVERRYYRAPEAQYYTAPRTTYVAPRRYTYAADGYYTAPRYYYSVPAYAYDDAPAYGYTSYGYDAGYTYAADGSCGWLYRRAINTGSPYWWNRYNDCID
jgi:hypothetical protein